MPTTIDDDSSKYFCLYCKDQLITVADIIASFHLRCQQEIDNYLSPKDLFIKNYPHHRTISSGWSPISQVLLAKDGKLGFSPARSFLFLPTYEQHVSSIFTYYAKVETPDLVYFNQSRFKLDTINELIELIYQTMIPFTDFQKITIKPKLRNAMLMKNDGTLFIRWDDSFAFISPHFEY